ncbi:MAG: antibiotic biosynthesis monooxygenase [Rhodanobacteraceae bacterium]|nr:antibiotic biosynthesis monooxygenase [Rhodanobacteraceae bacterium]
MIATSQARTGCAGEVEAALRALLVPTRAEDGCEEYLLYRELARADRFFMLERWHEDAALTRHPATPRRETLRERLEGCVEQLSVARLQRIE